MENKRFYLSNERKIGGVCAGISEYFSVDVTFVRVIFIAFLISGILTWWTLVIYFLLWLVAPRRPV